LELDDSLAEAHVALAFSLEQGDWNWSATEGEFKRAFEVNPNSGDAHLNYAAYLIRMGRKEEAIAEGRRFQELSPALPGATGDWDGSTTSRDVTTSYRPIKGRADRSTGS